MRPRFHTCACVNRYGVIRVPACEAECSSWGIVSSPSPMSRPKNRPASALLRHDVTEEEVGACWGAVFVLCRHTQAKAYAQAKLNEAYEIRGIHAVRGVESDLLTPVRTGLLCSRSHRLPVRTQ